MYSKQDSLLHRKVYKEVPPRVKYSLTDIGRRFLPVDKRFDFGEEYLNLLSVKIEWACFNRSRV